MDLAFSDQPRLPHKTHLLRAGYHEFFDRATGKTSYMKRLGPEFYPRFHAYVEEAHNKVWIRLHLDQKKPSYGAGTRAHAGEYAGPVVEREIERLRGVIDRLQQEAPVAPEEKKGFFRRIFG